MYLYAIQKILRPFKKEDRWCAHILRMDTIWLQNVITAMAQNAVAVQKMHISIYSEL